MNHLKIFNEYIKENLATKFFSLLKRDKNNDVFFLDFFNLMKEDFEKSNKNLFKTKFALEKPSEPKGRFTYRFGYFDTKIDVVSMGNAKVGDIVVDIFILDSTVDLKLKRDELDNMFNTPRIFKGRFDVKIEYYLENPDYNPKQNDEDWTQYELKRKKNIIGDMSWFEYREKYGGNKDKYRIYNYEEKKMDVSYDILQSVFGYFLQEWENQYPELYKASEYLNFYNIRSYLKDKTFRTRANYQ